jgi:antitoxin CptB
LNEVQKQKIRWQARRGLLELDLFLQRFLAQHFDQLDEASQWAFHDLLLIPDVTLLDLCQGKTTLADERLNNIVALIRQNELNKI